MKWDAELATAVGAVRDAAAVLTDTYRQDAVVRKADGKDVKTEADSVAERAIVDRLADTGIPILAEEHVRQPASEDGLRWIVDPLDGTMNFTRNFHISAVSVALWAGTTPVLGVIADLGRGVVYTGSVGNGAWRDSSPIRVSSISAPAQAILATGLPVTRDYSDDALHSFFERIRAFKKIRMIGSAAMSLALVADGTFDAYLEEDIMLWDVAAGIAIVEAAGGRCQVRPARSEHAVTAFVTNGRFTL